MKKLLSLLLILLLTMLTAIVPLTASALNTQALFDNLKLSDVKIYDTALPKNGVKKTLKYIEGIWK